MTTKIDTTTIDETYPVAGQDNDTSGFRTNFTNINAQLNQAGFEITELQNYAVLSGTIDNNATPATNNLRSSTIINGTYANFHSAVVQRLDDGSSGSIEINVASGGLQKITLSVDTRISFINWPAATYFSARYATVRLVLSLALDATPAGVDIIGFTSSGVVNSTGRFKEIDFPSVHINHDSKVIIDAWSYDGGSTFFLQYIGEFIASPGE